MRSSATFKGVPATAGVGCNALTSSTTVARVAVAVTVAGSIGFVGLIVPHLVRSCTGPDHRIVLPAAALAGGTLLVIADTIARTMFAPRQLPVGAVTALIGVPIFLALMRRQQPAL